MIQPDEKISKARGLLTDATADLQQVLAATRTAERGRLNDMLWQARRMTGNFGRYFSQSGQDWFIDQVLLREKTDGVFVDVGGYDGVAGSNTFFFELFRNWSGLLIEPVAALYEAARSVRRCQCRQAAVASDARPRPFLEVQAGYTQMSGFTDSYDPKMLQALRGHPDHAEDIQVISAHRLDDILRDAGISRIDFLSLDIEGGELDVLEDFDLHAFDVGVISVENPAHRPELRDQMQARGYRLVELLGVDEIYCSAAVLAAVRVD